MRKVKVVASARTSDADGVFDAIRDFSRYPALCPSVREVEFERLDGDLIDSTWAVNFRNGILKWSERDLIDDANRRISFTQTAGDFEEFQGSWVVEPAGPATRVTFEAAFDLGIPSLAPIIDPIAEQALQENIVLILRGLLRVELEVKPDDPDDSFSATGETGRTPAGVRQ